MKETSTQYSYQLPALFLCLQFLITFFSYDLCIKQTRQTSPCSNVVISFRLWAYQFVVVLLLLFLVWNWLDFGKRVWIVLFLIHWRKILMRSPRDLVSSLLLRTTFMWPSSKRIFSLLVYSIQQELQFLFKYVICMHIKILNLIFCEL